VAARHSAADHSAPPSVLALTMIEGQNPLVDARLYPEGALAAAPGSAIAWSAIMGGVIGAIAVTLVLMALGSAFGFGSISPWPGVGAKGSTFVIGTGIWLIVTQWLSSMTGGYLAGRLRTRWHGLHGDEVFFRDTAHGFLTWATATVVVATIAVLAGALMNPAVPVVDIENTREATEAVRKAAATLAGFTGFSLVVGAFIASAAGAVGGRLRDLHP